jgi:hypothetical protein
MEGSRFVLIPCRTCKATTIVLVECRLPLMCARCRTPYDPASASFHRAAAPSSMLATAWRHDRRSPVMPGLPGKS